MDDTETIGSAMVDLDSIPLDDKKTFDMLSKGLNVGVFQLEAGWIRGILKDIKPSSLAEIAAVTALIRPGSLDNGGPREYAERKRSGYTNPDIHPELDREISAALAETYGVLVYQEQVLEIIRIVTGWDYGQADLLFYAFRKKKLEALAEAKPDFFAASQYSHSATEAVWERLVAFGDYGFNKSHSVGYAYITYYTAYLKANYPIEFITALMTGDADDHDKLREYIAEAKRLGISVLPPDINESTESFTPTKKGIRYGLAAIKGLGEATVSAIARLRPFGSIDEFLRRADSTMLNSRVLEALVKSGSLDSLWSDRESALAELPRLARLAGDHRKSAAFGERTLLRIRYQPKPISRETTSSEEGSRSAAFEQETLGVQLTYPKLILNVPRELTGAETGWLYDVLKSREPESEVWLRRGNARAKLPLKSSAKGLERVVSKIGIELFVE
jgi:DNA polymerase-3 subunit alpha